MDGLHVVPWMMFLTYFTGSLLFVVFRAMPFSKAAKTEIVVKYDLSLVVCRLTGKRLAFVDGMTFTTACAFD